MTDRRSSPTGALSWRCAVSTRWLVSLSMAVYAAAAAYYVPRDVGWPIAVVVIAVVGLLVRRMTFHPRIEIAGSDSTIVNPIRTRVIPLDRVREVTSGYADLYVRTWTGSNATAWA